MEKAGFKSAFVSGYAVSATLLGEPDMGLLTMPEMARKAGQISSAAPSLVVFADADTGGGNVLNVQRTIKTLIASGCKGVFIEDKDWPKRPSAGNLRSNPVIAMEEFAGKVAAAREAIGDSDFFLVARTDARGTSAKFGFDDAVTRANLYMDAGADASFIVGPRTPEELAEVCKRTHGPRVASMIEGSITPMLTFDELKAMGFDIVIHPLSSLYAATKALTNVYETLKTKGTTRDELASLSNYKDFNQIINGEDKFAVMERLTSRDEGTKLTVKVRAPSREV
jgi:2-methylisocitrate lyase-like PEP mutase family enzyme